VIVSQFIGSLVASYAAGHAATDLIAQLWSRYSSSLREGIGFVGPVAFGIALIFASRLATARSVVFPVTGTKSGAAWVLRTWVLLSSASLAGYIIGQVPAYLTVQADATSGQLDGLVAVGVIPLIGAYVGLGLLIGCVVRKATGVLAGLLFGAVFTLVGSIGGPRLWPIAPTWGYGYATAGFRDTTAISTFRIFFFLSVIITSLLAASWFVAERSPIRVRVNAGVTAVIAVPVLISILVFSNPTAIQARVPNPPSVCDTVSETKVCVHAAHATLLPEITSVLAAIVDTVGHDYVESRYGRIRDEELKAWRPGALSFDVILTDSEAMKERVALNVAAQLSGFWACSTTTSSVQRQVAAGIQWWIFSEAYPSGDDSYWPSSGGATETKEHLESLSAAQLQQLFLDHGDAIEGCSLDRELLP